MRSAIWVIKLICTEWIYRIAVSHNQSCPVLLNMLARRSVRQFFVFILGGGTSAVIDVGLTALLLKTGVQGYWAVSLGFTAGLIFNYIFHARITFQSLISHRSIYRYLSVVGLNYFLTLWIVWLCHADHRSILFGKIASLPFVAINGYVLGRFWIFSGGQRESKGGGK